MKLRWVLLTLIMLLSLANGFASPRLIMVFALQGIWYPAFLPAGLGWMFGLSGAVLALLYFMLSGVPAAIAEKLAGGRMTMDQTHVLWLFTLAVMSWPTLQTWLAYV
jgi:hypothetical protein